MEPSPAGRLPAQFRLDLSIPPGNAREFELFRSGMSPLYAMDAANPRTRAAFQSRMTSYQFADIAISVGHSSAATYERSKQTVARTGLDTIGLVIYSEGGCRLDTEGRAAEVHPGDVCVLDMTRPSSLQAPDFADLSVLLPRALIEPHLADPDCLHGLILDRSNPLNAMLVSHVQTLFAQAPMLNVSDVRAAALGASALIAAFAGASSQGQHTIRNAAAAMSLQTARKIIDANLHERDLGADFICRQLGMSRSKLYRLFEPAGGVSQYILQRRMTRAYRAIANSAHTRERIGTIAARFGFSNVSVFSRAFRLSHGVSPTELRDDFARAEKVGNKLSFENDFEIMSRWLLGKTTS